MNIKERDKLLKRIHDALPTKEDMLREARDKLGHRAFHPSFSMGAYFSNLKVMKEIEQIFKEDIEQLKKKLE